jgi:uncharacterized SAM-binding protein YcdF (DUF218 family)
MARCRLCRGLAAAGVLLAVLYAGTDYYLPALARFLNVSEIPEAVDYVLVLGGGNANRPFAAAALFRKELARQVLLPTDTLLPEAADGILPPEHEIDRKVLQARGVPADAVIFLDGSSDSTLQEAMALKRFLDARPRSSVAVVTTMYHSRRARLQFRQILGEGAGKIRFLGVPADGFDETNWWRFERGIVAYALEYAKLALYLLGRPLSWLVLLLVLCLGVLAARTRRWLVRC